jgi:hypothetical protein
MLFYTIIVLEGFGIENNSMSLFKFIQDPSIGPG